MFESTTLPGVTMTFVASHRGRDGQHASVELPKRTLGVDLGDRKSDLCLLDEAGEVIDRRPIETTRPSFQCALQQLAPCRLVIEVGTHSPWVSRLAQSLGHEVIVANPRKVQLIAKGTRKNDRKDAELLARLGRADVALLSPIQHRGLEAQHLLVAVRQRDSLVRRRVSLISGVRGLVKSLGERVQGCSPETFPRRARADLPDHLVTAVEPTLVCIMELTQHIRQFDRVIESPPEPLRTVVGRLRQIPGVGPILGLTFVLTIDDPVRFHRSRDVGPFLGLVPRQHQTGLVDRQTSITRAGNPYLRKLLINAAHHILSRGPQTRLQEFGLRLEARGGRASRQRTAVAVARKLAVMMHRMWVTGEDYQPKGGPRGSEMS
jgi:transposase